MRNGLYLVFVKTYKHETPADPEVWRSATPPWIGMARAGCLIVTRKFQCLVKLSGVCSSKWHKNSISYYSHSIIINCKIPTSKQSGRIPIGNYRQPIGTRFWQLYLSFRVNKNLILLLMNFVNIIAAGFARFYRLEFHARCSSYDTIAIYRLNTFIPKCHIYIYIYIYCWSDEIVFLLSSEYWYGVMTRR